MTYVKYKGAYNYVAVPFCCQLGIAFGTFSTYYTAIKDFYEANKNWLETEASKYRYLTAAIAIQYNGYRMDAYATHGFAGSNDLTNWTVFGLGFAAGGATSDWWHLTDIDDRYDWLVDNRYETGGGSWYRYHVFPQRSYGDQSKYFGDQYFIVDSQWTTGNSPGDTYRVWYEAPSRMYPYGLLSDSVAALPENYYPYDVYEQSTVDGKDIWIKRES